MALFCGSDKTAKRFQKMIFINSYCFKDKKNMIHSTAHSSLSRIKPSLRPFQHCQLAKLTCKASWRTPLILAPCHSLLKVNSHQACARTVWLTFMCFFNLCEHIFSLVLHVGVTGMFIWVVDTTELAESIVDFLLGCLRNTRTNNSVITSVESDNAKSLWKNYDS